MNILYINIIDTALYFAEVLRFLPIQETQRCFIFWNVHICSHENGVLEKLHSQQVQSWVILLNEISCTEGHFRSSGVILTHWPLGNLNAILKIECSILLYWLVSSDLLIMNATGLNIVNTGPGNGLVPSGNKPLPEPMLTRSLVALWRR